MLAPTVRQGPIQRRDKIFARLVSWAISLVPAPLYVMTARAGLLLSQKDLPSAQIARSERRPKPDQGLVLLVRLGPTPKTKGRAHVWIVLREPLVVLPGRPLV